MDKATRTRHMESKILFLIGDYDKGILNKREFMDILCALINREISANDSHR